MTRKEELKEYLELLLELEVKGYKTKYKIESVLNALHNEMGFINVEPLDIRPFDYMKKNTHPYTYLNPFDIWCGSTNGITTTTLDCSL